MGRRLHPLLGMWAAVVAGTLTLAGVQLNQVVIDVLLQHAASPVATPPASRGNVVLNA